MTPNAYSIADLNLRTSPLSSALPERALAKMAAISWSVYSSAYAVSSPWSLSRHPCAWNTSCRLPSACMNEAKSLISTSAAAASLSVHAFHVATFSTVMALSGRQPGRTWIANVSSSAICQCSDRSSVGSSVVHTSTTSICFMMPRQLNSGVASLALHASQIPLAVSGLSSRSLIPNGRFNSRCDQWYSGLQSVFGTVSAHLRNFSQGEASPVQKRSFTPAARMARHL